MSGTTEILRISDVARPNFPSEWHEIIHPDHFWMQWRHRVLLSALRSVGIDTAAPKRVLDVGSGQGIIRLQFQNTTSWIVDGCDIDVGALEMTPQMKGDTLLYDVCEKRPEFRAKYDMVFLMDVVEHIEKPQPFLEAVFFHLKPGGYVVVNVPALQTFYSQYDKSLGHFRRYNRKTLGEEVRAAGLTPLKIGYWGFGLVPVLAARTALMKFRRYDGDRELVSEGMQPPNEIVHSLLKLWMSVETRILPSPPLGSSVYAIAKKA